MAGANQRAQIVEVQDAVEFQVAVEFQEGMVKCWECPLYIWNSQNAKDRHHEEYHLVSAKRFTKPKFAPAKGMMKNSPAATTQGPSTVESTQKKQQTKKNKIDKQLNEAIARRAARN